MQIVIVTGAAGGIGRVYAKALAEAGFGVVAADLNAVPPLGIEGIEVTDDGAGGDVDSDRKTGLIGGK